MGNISIRKSMFIERDMARDNNTSGGGVEASIAFVIVRGTKIDTRKRAWLKFVRGGRGDVGKA